MPPRTSRAQLLTLLLITTLSVSVSAGADVHRRQQRQRRPVLETLSRVRRSSVQAVEVQFPCFEDSDCYPRQFGNSTIPPDLISCDNSTGVCTCNDCFVLLRDVCAVADCHSYDSGKHKCKDERKSQKTAFFLSLFLSGLGAANFYIGQNGLGGGQMGLLLATIVAIVTIVCLPFCIVLCVEEWESNAATCCFVVFLLLTLVFILLSVVVMICWWVADLVTFIQNSRDDGNHCPLIEDL